MASTATLTSSIPHGSLKSAFAKLDDDIFQGLAASQPGSPSLGATKPSSQPTDLPSPLSFQPAATTAPTSQPTSTPAQKKTSISPVLTLLTTPNLTAATIAPLTTHDAMLLCPNWNIPESQHRTRRHSSAAHTGSENIAQAFSDMRRHRSGLKFEIETSFAASSAGTGGEDVAVFGHVQWQSEHLGRRVQVPFAVWAKVDGMGRVESLQIVGE